MENKCADESVEESFHLRWSHFSSNVLRVFDGLLRDESFADLTLVCSHPDHLGQEIRAHKVVLSACSSFFRSVLLSQPATVQPVLILPSEVSGVVMRHLLDFVYRGEVDVQRDALQDVLHAANLLQIKGLHPEELEEGLDELESRSVKEEALQHCSAVMDNDSDNEQMDDSKEINEDHEALNPLADDEDTDLVDPMEHSMDPMEAEETDSETDYRRKGSRSYTSSELNQALSALRSRSMTLSRASTTFGVPPTTLWQKAARQGIATASRKPNESGRNWTGEALNDALNAMRNNEISANRAAKVFGIPSSTLYKIARKEGIALATPFNAVQTAWTQEDLTKALEAIKKGMAVQRASVKFGIPSGTLYGRCRKFGIELAKTSPAPWSEDAMCKALESVRSGRMSINQAAIHHCLPYSSLYGRINKLKREHPQEWEGGVYVPVGHLEVQDGRSRRSRNDVDDH